MVSSGFFGGGEKHCAHIVCSKPSEDNQQQGCPLRNYFIPGSIGKGLDLDSRVRPAMAPQASGNLGIGKS